MTHDEKTYLEDLMIKSHNAKGKELSDLVGAIKDDIADLKQNYSKRELDHFIGEINDNTKKILEQTIKTNDRVNSLENHRAYLWGAYTILTLLGGVIIYLSTIAIETKINKAVEQALINNTQGIYEEK